VLNLNTVISFLLSSTAAKRTESSPEGTMAIQNAEPVAESIENSPMNLPFFVNSTISPFWLGVEEAFTASPDFHARPRTREIKQKEKPRT
jgi:hypothetical protein